MSAILDSFDDISKAAPEPIYLQLKNIIAARIASGEWRAGQKLPSENELVADRRLRPLKVSDAELKHAEYVTCLEESRGLRVTDAFLELVRTQSHD